MFERLREKAGFIGERRDFKKVWPDRSKYSLVLVWRSVLDFFLYSYVVSDYAILLFPY